MYVICSVATIDTVEPTLIRQKSNPLSFETGNSGPLKTRTDRNEVIAR